MAFDCSETLLESTDDSIQVVGIGLRNIAAVATRDAVLIADLDSTQSVSDAVRELKRREVPQAESFRKEFRPWGHYETLALGPRYQVKSIVVRPGGQLSLQSHVHRAEHWIVVEGTANVTIGKDEMLVGENQSVYVPLAEVHRLSNPGKVDLRLIEVQTGAYLIEDDIIRYEDVYDRA
jgi:mannose-1-phosphate guanylyltransferase/mannose-6-phosphate isomerase